jgi:hypothetical protein
MTEREELSSRRVRWESAHQDRVLTEVERAQRCGLSLTGLNRIRSLLDERTRNSWDVGDLLVTVYGPGSGSGISDGSRSKLSMLAEELGCSVSVLVAQRATSGVWPRKERRSCSWTLHSMLRGLLARFVVLGDFLTDCERSHQRASCKTLEHFLDLHDLRTHRVTDPVRAIEKLTKALDLAGLELLIEHLQWRLFEAQSAA